MLVIYPIDAMLALYVVDLMYRVYMHICMYGSSLVQEGASSNFLDEQVTENRRASVHGEPPQGASGGAAAEDAAAWPPALSGRSAQGSLRLIR